MTQSPPPLPTGTLDYRSPEPPPPRPGWRSMLAGWAAIPIVLSVVAQVFWGFPPVRAAATTADDASAAYFVGHMVGLMIFPLLATVLVFAISRSQLARRSLSRRFSS